MNKRDLLEKEKKEKEKNIHQRMENRENIREFSTWQTDIWYKIQQSVNWRGCFKIQQSLPLSVQFNAAKDRAKISVTFPGTSLRKRDMHAP